MWIFGILATKYLIFKKQNQVGKREALLETPNKQFQIDKNNYLTIKQCCPN
jgi:hypothetical protein